MLKKKWTSGIGCPDAFSYQRVARAYSIAGMLAKFSKATPRHIIYDYTPSQIPFQYCNFDIQHRFPATSIAVATWAVVRHGL